MINMEPTNHNKALELWNSFRNEVMYYHRFYPSHPVLEKLAAIAKQCIFGFCIWQRALRLRSLKFDRYCILQ